jgi:hypothetical protein
LFGDTDIKKTIGVGCGKFVNFGAVFEVGSENNNLRIDFTKLEQCVTKAGSSRSRFKRLPIMVEV